MELEDILLKGFRVTLHQIHPSLPIEIHVHRWDIPESLMWDADTLDDGIEAIAEYIEENYPDDEK